PPVQRGGLLLVLWGQWLGSSAWCRFVGRGLPNWVCFVGREPRIRPRKDRERMPTWLPDWQVGSFGAARCATLGGPGMGTALRRREESGPRKGAGAIAGLAVGAGRVVKERGRCERARTPDRGGPGGRGRT